MIGLDWSLLFSEEVQIEESRGGFLFVSLTPERKSQSLGDKEEMSKT
jgi:hypothetical protein